MKRVLDSCVALKWALPEADSDKARRLRDDFRNALVELLAPDVFAAEVGHSLARAERRGIITPPALNGEAAARDILPQHLDGVKDA